MPPKINKSLFVLAAQGIGLSKDFDRYLEGKGSLFKRLFSTKKNSHEESLRKQVIEINKPQIIKELQERFYPKGLDKTFHNLSSDEIYKRLDEEARKVGFTPPSAGYTITPFYKNNGTKRAAGYVIKTGNKALVCYHGTKFSEVFDGGYKEIRHDLQSKPVEMSLANGSKVHVHKGFKKEYDVSKESLNNVLDNLSAGTELIFTGHSLGGSVAQIAALDAQTTTQKRFNVAATIVYGSPPVFAKEDSQYVSSLLEDRTFRVEQTLDPVPGLFSRKLSHIGKVIRGDAGSVKLHGSNTYNHMAAHHLEQEHIDEASVKGTAKIESSKKPSRKSFLSFVKSSLIRKKTPSVLHHTTVELSSVRASKSRSNRR